MCYSVCFLPELYCTITQYYCFSSHNQRSQVISSGMTLQTSTYSTVPRTLYGHLLGQYDYLRITQSISDVLYSTTMPNNLINHSTHSEGFRIDQLPAEPLIMVPRLIVNPYIDYTDPIVAENTMSLATAWSLKDAFALENTSTYVGTKAASATLVGLCTTILLRITLL